MREYDMRSTYTVAAVPSDVTSRTAKPAIPLPVKIPYTLADAEEVAKRYNENPVYIGMLRNSKYNHFVPFNIEALTLEPPSWYVEDRDA
jgi:glycine cleavage system pyridoxal-binding protein P